MLNPIQWVITSLKYLLSFLFPSSECRKSIYGLDHAVLNLPVPPPTMWMNMGYWKEESDFAGACKALLHQVLMVAGLLDSSGQPRQHPDDRRFHLVDLGIGCGDQSVELMGAQRILEASKSGPIRQSLFDSYVGITDLPAQAEIARIRLSTLHLTAGGNASTTLATDVSSTISRAKIFCANAATPAIWNAEVREALPPPSSSGNSNGAMTWILALDALYHFWPSRKPVLQYARSTLGASLMAFDILRADNVSIWDMFLLRLISLVMGNPYSNLLTRTDYEALLVTAGYSLDKIEIKDISEHVFGGLASFIRRKDAQLRPFGISIGRYRVAARLFDWWAKTGVVRGVIVVARLD